MNIKIKKKKINKMEDNSKQKKNWTLISRRKVYDGSPYINIFKDKVILQMEIYWMIIIE